MKENKILFISANQHTVPYPVYPIGLSYISTYLKEKLPNYESKIVDLNFDSIEELKSIIKKYNPKYIGISFRNVDDVNSYNREEFVTHYKSLVDNLRTVTDSKIIVGGAGFSIFPELMFNKINPDFGVYGEGEETILKLINKLDNNEDYSDINRLVYKQNGQCIFNKNESYFSDLNLDFDKDLIDFYWEKSGMLNIQTKRGCPYNCIYCTYPLIEGSKVRTLNTDKIVDTLKKLYYQKGIDYVFFTDSVFNISNQYNYELAEKIISSGIKVHWGGYFTFKNLDENLLKVLKKSGLQHVEFGTEAISEKCLKTYGKEFTVKDVLEKSALCNTLDIPFAHFLITGGYGETDETVNETFENSKLIDNTVFFTFVGMRIYPGTKLQEYAIREGVIDKNDDLLIPKYYLSKEVNYDTLKERAQKTRKRWVFPDEDTTTITNKLRQRNKKRAIMGIYDNVIADRETIQMFIPQRAPMVMVEKLHKAEGGQTLSSLVVSESNIFCKDGFLQEAGLIENIAQTAAVGVGFEYRNEDKDVPTGYIGAVQKLTIHNLPTIGKTIFTEVNVEHKVFNTTLINGKITCDNQLIADCSMKIFLNE